MAKKANIELLQQKIGYKFKNTTTLVQALTHPSFRHNMGKGFNYEKLEFLGDSVLGCVMASMVFTTYNQQKEGFMSKMLANLVSRAQCHKIANILDLKSHILLSSGEEKNQCTTSNLSNCIEAIIGAIYIDCNESLDEVRNFISTNWHKDINSPLINDPKTELQEITQSTRATLPTYTTIRTTGTDHVPVFSCTLQIKGMPDVVAHGNSKKASEKNAAMQMISQLKNKK